jgi:hypothetical protein
MIQKYITNINSPPISGKSSKNNISSIIASYNRICALGNDRINLNFLSNIDAISNLYMRRLFALFFTDALKNPRQQTLYGDSLTNLDNIVII